ncbi:MAG: hypothetical protein ACIARR_09410 [Phycisphaerales bacterium JB059]
MHDDELTEGLDPEGPSAEDLDRFGDETRTCPHCGSETWDQAQVCHVCGEELEAPVKGQPPMPMWAWITLFVVLMVVLMWVL